MFSIPMHVFYSISKGNKKELQKQTNLMEEKSKEEKEIKSSLVQCPFCAEDIKKEAIVCKHCNRDLN